MKRIDGDLIELAKDGYFDVIVHGCNCWNTMNAGIALQIKREFPEAWEVDRNTIKGYDRKLGRYSQYQYSSGLIVINAYTQYRPGLNSLDENYKAIRSVFKSIAKEYPNSKIGIPAIGSGLAGGDFDTIWNIIEEETDGMNITMVIYNK